MTYRPVPVKEERHRPRKASLPQRRCVRPKGPLAAYGGSAAESVASQHQTMNVGMATARCTTGGVGHAFPPAPPNYQR